MIPPATEETPKKGKGAPLLLMVGGFLILGIYFFFVFGGGDIKWSNVFARTEDVCIEEPTSSGEIPKKVLIKNAEETLCEKLHNPGCLSYDPTTTGKWGGEKSTHPIRDKYGAPTTTYFVEFPDDETGWQAAKNNLLRVYGEESKVTKTRCSSPASCTFNETAKIWSDGGYNGHELLEGTGIDPETLVSSIKDDEEKVKKVLERFGVQEGTRVVTLEKYNSSLVNRHRINGQEVCDIKLPGDCFSFDQVRNWPSAQFWLLNATPDDKVYLWFEDEFSYRGPFSKGKIPNFPRKGGIPFRVAGKGILRMVRLDHTAF